MVTNESPLKYLFRPEEIELLICGSRVSTRGPRGAACGVAWRGVARRGEAEMSFLKICRTWISRRWKKPPNMTAAIPGTRL